MLRYLRHLEEESITLLGVYPGFHGSSQLNVYVCFFYFSYGFNNNNHDNTYNNITNRNPNGLHLPSVCQGQGE